MRLRAGLCGGCEILLLAGPLRRNILSQRSRDGWSALHNKAAMTGRKRGTLRLPKGWPCRRYAVNIADSKVAQGQANHASKREREEQEYQQPIGILSAVGFGAHPWTLVACLQVRCGSASRVWRCGVWVWCYRLAGRPERAECASTTTVDVQCGTNAYVDQSDCFSTSGVLPAARSCLDVAFRLMNVGVGEYAAHYGTTPPAPDPTP